MRRRGIGRPYAYIVKIGIFDHPVTPRTVSGHIAEFLVEDSLGLVDKGPASTERLSTILNIVVAGSGVPKDNFHDSICTLTKDPLCSLLLYTAKGGGGWKKTFKIWT